jgi:hypothetical protein
MTEPKIIEGDILLLATTGQGIKIKYITDIYVSYINLATGKLETFSTEGFASMLRSGVILDNIKRA